MTIAVTKGRIEKLFYKILLDKKISNKIICPDRSLRIYITNEISLILVKPIDVIKLVSNEYADIGIVGSDTIEEESNNNIVELLDLNTGKCSFALASIPNTNINNINTIATKYPNITRRLIKVLGINPSIVKMEGSLELAPLINYADAIVDLVETGNTLNANGLIVLEYLLDISTRVITNNDSINNTEVIDFVKRLER